MFEQHDQPFTGYYRHGQLARLHDEALAEAMRLRREAIADFWRGANGMLANAAMTAERAATRLAYRLRRRDVASC